MTSGGWPAGSLTLLRHGLVNGDCVPAGMDRVRRNRRGFSNCDSLGPWENEHHGNGSKNHQTVPTGRYTRRKDGGIDKEGGDAQRGKSRETRPGRGK